MNIRAKVMQEPTVIEARYGPCIITKVRILQNGEDVAIFSKLGDPVAASKTKGQHVLIAKNAKGKYVILDDTSSSTSGEADSFVADEAVSNRNSNNIEMNRPSSQQEGSYYTHRSNGSTASSQTYSVRANVGRSQPVSNGSNTASNSEEDILDLPVLSDVDKRKMMGYIRSQSKLLKFCYDTVCKDFKDLEHIDPRGVRSLAISLLISANQCRDRYLK